jgi:ATP-binding cassette subfamily C (CFTR/MRP) protein 1
MGAILTVSSDLPQILDSDMILVMSGGRVAEYAPPQELLKNEVGCADVIVRDSVDNS